MKRTITAEEAAKLGIVTNHEQMENGEYRFRLMGADGNGYIRTEATDGGWQKSHFHNQVAETYVVERGAMALAVQAPENPHQPSITIYRRGEAVTTPVGIVHNVYLSTGAIIHTIKHGGSKGEPDWHGAVEFDELLNAVMLPEL